MPTAISVKKLSIEFDDHTVLDNVSFDIQPGEIVYVLGGNGSGKTTLMKSLLGMIDANKGEITIMGKKRSQETVSEHIGYVPQYNKIDKTFPISVREVIRLECDNAHQCSLDTIEHLRLFESEHLLDRLLENLSGGEFQKVLIARAMVSEPDILILDEPNNNLDQNSQKELFNLLRKLSDQGKTVLVVTHDHSLVRGEQRMFLLEGGELSQGHANELLKHHHIH